MSVSRIPDSPAAIAARLRAAGCVFAEDEARLLIAAAAGADELTAMTGRRAGGEPLEYVLGYAEFCGLRIVIEPGVFVPRRRTEFLARVAAARLIGWASAPGPVVLVDMCCGSGAVGAAMAALAAAAEEPARPGPGLAGRLEVHAADIDPAAVRCARRNLAAAGGLVYSGDLFGPLPPALAGQVAVLVANVPYVPTAEIGLLPPEARLHEPAAALDGGSDGLDVLREVAAAAPRWLTPGGWLLSEISERQLDAAAGILSGNGLVPSFAADGEIGATVVIGWLPDAAGRH